MDEIRLSDEDRAFVDEEIRFGIYRNADEAVHAALRLLRSKEGKLVELRRLIQEGIDDVDAGRCIEFESAEDLTKHIIAMAEDEKHAPAQAQGEPAGSARSLRRV